MKINSLAVFCGAKKGNNAIYCQHAAETGILLAQNNVTLIYGGGNIGIMGVLADAMIANDGRVIGIIPTILLEWEQQHKGITELLVVEDMHVRKKKMYELCDAALVLPGGFGTLDEFFEMLTWNQLSIHDKQLFIMNSDGFFDHLIKHIYQLEKNGFLYEPVDKRMKFLKNPEELLPLLRP